MNISTTMMQSFLVDRRNEKQRVVFGKILKNYMKT